jgi:hypothetical protein
VVRAYQGLPITPETAAVEAIGGGNAFVSYRYPDQLRIAIECAQSMALDNGAFSAWSEGKPIKDWSDFYAWAAGCKRLPMCDFAVVPDIIDGSEADNDALLAEWPLGHFFGAPVWHMHESLARLERLVHEWPRVCFGSSGEYRVVGTELWWGRMADALGVACDADGFPKTKLHGLRMLNPKVFTRIPLSSADSTNIGRNVGIDKAWKGPYPPAGKPARARVMRQRCEAYQSPPTWDFSVPPLNGDQLW